MLYVCGTPLGNLEDITLRTLRILAEADCIAAEDTRHTLKLLNHYNIKTPMVSYHEHNEREKGPDLIRQLLDGRNIALVTDAGMPGISDPGAALIRACHENGVPVTSAPGPTAAMTALVLSGMDTVRFAFEGFLPTVKKERAARLAEIARERRTLIFYAAPHHLAGDAADLRAALGNRETVLARELTKIHEEIWRGDLTALIERRAAGEIKGEIVLIVKGWEEAPAEPDGARVELSREAAAKMVDGYVSGGMGKMDAIKKAARELGVGKREIYRILETDTISD
ncbi:MAG: 16S rRNA (cytidine(1402)-2'-O)-methyltransferase [Defluviitaleaceae bacterium]|nr:16S rRNA (cytidine(1402)-2'-O)-methyltransferase [Defluviitaleaceae bacterium]